MSAPWMPLYVRDYLADTAHLRAAESGAYLHLIMAYWVSGNLPEDDRQLATIAKMTLAEWKRARPTIQAFFHDGWKHGRIDKELARTAEVAAGYASRASQAAKKRWAKNASSNAASNASSIPQAMLGHAEPQPHTQRKEDIAPDGAPADLKYAFEQGVIRLSAKDFSKWQKAYVNIDLAAELIAMAPWAAEQRDWFFAVSGALAKKNREAKVRLEAARSGQNRPLTPSGNPWPEGIM